MHTLTIDYDIGVAHGQMLIYYEHTILGGWEILTASRPFDPDDYHEELTWLALAVL